jgi:hypothetical protein
MLLRGLSGAGLGANWPRVSWLKAGVGVRVISTEPGGVIAGIKQI